MNSRQGSRYIKRRMGDELKDKILVHNGIISSEIEKKKISILNCPRCNLVNAFENKYCSKCSYPLKPEAYEEIKTSENQKFHQLQQQHEQDMHLLKEDMNNKFTQLISLIQQNPLLTNAKPEVLTKIIEKKPT